ncbi:alpha/beta hydrolase fold domain-containing protein [Pseudonocardia hierapolitana]|uniref:alpha/beta hydrolase fold domain-containing protein n=1 Tax=Pseudonocardia hierapolitana TaxID=1128676 RepID=UPI003CCC6C09
MACPLLRRSSPFSASLDLTLSSGSMSGKEGIDPIFTRETPRPVLAMYCPGEDVHQPLLSPALTADLTGFPPTLLYMTPLGWRPCPAGNRAARTD